MGEKWEEWAVISPRLEWIFRCAQNHRKRAVAVRRHRLWRKRHDAISIERNFHGETFYSTEHPDGQAEYPDGQLVDFYDPQRAIRTPHFHYIRHLRPEKRGRQWFAREIQGARPKPNYCGFPEIPPPLQAEPHWPTRGKPHKIVRF